MGIRALRSAGCCWLRNFLCRQEKEQQRLISKQRAGIVIFDGIDLQS